MVLRFFSELGLGPHPEHTSTFLFSFGAHTLLGGLGESRWLFKPWPCLGSCDSCGMCVSPGLCRLGMVGGPEACVQSWVVSVLEYPLFDATALIPWFWVSC